MRPRLLSGLSGRRNYRNGQHQLSDFPVSAALQQIAYEGPEPRYLRAPWRLLRRETRSCDGQSACFDLLGWTQCDGPRDRHRSRRLRLFLSRSSPRRRISDRCPSRAGRSRRSAAETVPNGYAARLSPILDHLLYGTYLPGSPSAAKLSFRRKPVLRRLVRNRVPDHSRRIPTTKRGR